VPQLTLRPTAPTCVGPAVATIRRLHGHHCPGACGPAVRPSRSNSFSVMQCPNSWSNPVFRPSGLPVRARPLALNLHLPYAYPSAKRKRWARPSGLPRRASPLARLGRPQSESPALGRRLLLLQPAVPSGVPQPATPLARPAYRAEAKPATINSSPFRSSPGLAEQRPAPGDAASRGSLPCRGEAPLQLVVDLVATGRLTCRWKPGRAVAQPARQRPRREAARHGR
jgi:hypothetical protein